MKGITAFPLDVHVSVNTDLKGERAGLGSEAPQPDDSVFVCDYEMVLKASSVTELSRFKGTLVHVLLLLLVVIQDVFDDYRTALLA
jgi:hypothetical protein